MELKTGRIAAALAIAGLIAAGFWDGPRAVGDQVEAAPLTATGTPCSGPSCAPTATNTPGSFAPVPSSTPSRTATRTPTPGNISLPPSPTPTRTRTPLTITGPSPTNTPPILVAPPTVTPTPTLPVAGPPVLQGDIVPVRIELIQSVYRVGDTPPAPPVPLIARKGSLVRVWIDLTGQGGSRDVTVQLKAFRGGVELPPCSPLTNPAVTIINKPTHVNRDVKLDETANFRLLGDCNWLDGDSVTLQAKVSGVECTECLNNSIIQRTFSLESIRPVKVEFSWLRVNQKWPPVSTKGLDALKRGWPISEFEVTLVPRQMPASFDLAGAGLPGNNDFDHPFWAEYIGMLSCLQECCSSDESDMQVGTIHEDLVGCAGVGGGGWLLSGPRCSGTFRHEGGHGFGLAHASDLHSECDGGGCEPGFPFWHGGLNNYGWSEAGPSKLIGQGGQNWGWHSHDSMSYGGCTNAAPVYDNNDPQAGYIYCANWPPTLTYGRIAQRLRCADPQHDVPSVGFEFAEQQVYQQCFLNSGPFAPFVKNPWGGLAGHAHAEQGTLAALPRLPSGTAKLAAARGPVLRVAGTVQPDGSASFRHFYQLPDGSLRTGGDGDVYHIAAFDAAGRELARRGFATPVTYLHIPGPLPAHFAVTIPWRADLHRVVLFRSGQPLAERVISASAPQVRITSPKPGDRWGAGEATITWEASDADGDQVAVAIEHGDPATGKWQPLFRGAGGGSHSVDLRAISGGQRKLRLHATDGMRTTTVELDGLVSVENKAPIVTVLEHADELIEEGEAAPPEGYAFSASAFDIEDGRLTGSAIVWTSNRQGKLGEGESILIRNLQSGEHTITVTGTDKLGAKGSDSFTLTARIPEPEQLSPRGDQVLGSLSAELRWTPPSGSRWMHLQLVPSNRDGPGIDLLQSDLDFIQRAVYRVSEPQFGQPGSLYLMLPGMGYTWRLRYARTTGEPAEEDWSSWSEARFRTPARGSAGITAVSPPDGAQGVSRTPQVVWTNSDLSVFYYEVQVSRDASFNTDPQTATAMVYWVLIHGGVSNPLNSYQIPAAFPLEPGVTYHARVRPRIQGHGDPAAWSAAVSFTAG